MKKIILILAIAFFGKTSFSQNFANPSFENWANVGAGFYQDPSSWQTLNALAFFVCGEANVLKSSDAQTGNWSVELHTLPTVDNQAIGFPGIMTQSMAINSRPDKLGGFFKFSSPNLGDEAVIVITATRYNSATGQTEFIGNGAATFEPQNTFAQFEVELVYDPTYAGINPDSVSVTFISSSATDVDDEYLPGGIFTVDNINLSYLTNSTPKIADNLVKIFPIPANDFLNIETDKSLENVEFSIIDLNGKLLINTPIPTIDVANFKPGIYILQVKSNDAILNKKILIN